MKLKQLVFNSLPRSKSKQKKKLQQQQQQKEKEELKQRSLFQQSQVLSAAQKYLWGGTDRSPSCQFKSSTSAHYPIPEEGATLTPTHRDVNQNHSVTPLTSPMTLTSSPTSPSRRETSNKKSKEGSGKTLVVPKEKQKQERAVSRHFNVNLNFNNDVGDAKCACYKHLVKPLDSPEDFHQPPVPESRYYNLSSSSMEDSGFSSLPKTRTRIKTNPWLPSPRSTPSTSPDLSPMASSSSSPVYSDRRSFDSSDTNCPQLPHHAPHKSSSEEEPQQASRRENSNIYEEINTLNIQHTKQNHLSNGFSENFSARSTSDSDSLLQRSLLSETDNTGTDIRVTTDNNSASEKMSDNFKMYLDKSVDNASVISATLKKANKQVQDNQDQIYENHMFESHVNFDYEEAFESQLEARGVGQFVGSRDDLSDVSCDDRFNDPLGSRAHDFDSEYCPSNYDSSCNEYASETETDDTVCDDYYTETGLRRGGRPAPFNDIFRDYYHYADDEEEKDNSDDGFSLSSHTNLYRGTNDLTKVSYDSQDYSQSRTLGQVRISLQDKVNRLRRDKFIVDEKIREAQEEERLRIQEKMRFQKHMTLARKQMLLQTLQDLKLKLEGQSERLQQTYTAVLSMQQAVISSRKEALNHQRPPVAIPNTREAPF